MICKIFTERMSSRTLCFAALSFLAAILARHQIVSVLRLSLKQDQYSHILLIIPISAALMFLERKTIFSRVKFYLPAGLGLVFIALCAVFLSKHPLVGATRWLSPSMALFNLWCVIAFLFCFGLSACRAGWFPLLFLLLIVPIPDQTLQAINSFLQVRSADATYVLLKTARVPVLRPDPVHLSVPGLDIEVAKECSGIRSSVLLFVISLVLGHLFLNSWWKRALFIVLVIPITIIKNGLRIFVLTTLGAYVDPSYLVGRLHHQGGILYFLLALFLMTFVLYGLRGSVRKMRPLL